ncbi:aldehyde dehydrogenase family protein [Paraburkholderia susongensis]|uniref:Acyl-CoA reductase n=1 Tax=Paraburkholderia susongensis TaxID=1515439 RepID=A0A1X7LQJ5_9BURK|nr:aldehyde dehydrogenase family protein [Paraburkholderia susongensis]SMG55593.1 Acyl-CoA reductase [Paraburkholderia susongensis]
MSKKYLEIRNPFNKSVVGNLVVSTGEDVQKAVANAFEAWKEFRYSTPFERKTLLYALAEQIRKNADAMARTVSLEMGKTLREATNEIRRAQNTLKLSADAGMVLHGEVLPCAVAEGSPDKQATITYEPTGVLGAITPFNYPVNLLCHKLGPAIAAGNAVVAKPSPKAPLTADMLCRLAREAGFPPGLFQMVHGGADVAMALAHSPISLLSFTGGPAAGLALKNAAGLVRCLMELGGNDPMVVMPDADLGKAADVVIGHRFEIAGQSCAAVKKLYLHREIREEMLALLEARVANIRTGYPTQMETDMGTVIDEVAAQEVERRVKLAIHDGARLISGGERQAALFQPTLLDCVPPNTDLVKSETFGPVIAIRPFEAIDMVIDEVNESEYGLQAGVFTNDHGLIKRFSRELRVGGVMINEGPDFRAENVPFGGIKSSGLGREGVHVTLREMSETKVVID